MYAKVLDREFSTSQKQKQMKAPPTQESTKMIILGKFFSREFPRSEFCAI